MTRQFPFEILACPFCKQELLFKKEEGILVCSCCHRQFPVNKGVPNFLVDMDIGSEFDVHWKVFDFKKPAEIKINGAKKFLNPVLDNNGGGYILDMGCGDGTHAEVFREYENITYMGLDISDVVYKNARRFEDCDNIHFIRGDALNLPLKDSIVNNCFSFGVLAYVPNPFEGFSEIVRVTAPKGKIGIWFYPKGSGILWNAWQYTRRLLKPFGKKTARYISFLLAPFLSFLPTKSKISLRNASLKECAEIIYVNLAPNKITFYNKKELESWFNSLGVDVIKNSKRCADESPITLWGVKRGGDNG